MLIFPISAIDVVMCIRSVKMVKLGVNVFNDFKNKESLGTILTNTYALFSIDEKSSISSNQKFDQRLLKLCLAEQELLISCRWANMQE